MYIAVVEYFHISPERILCFEKLESLIMGEAGINAYTLQPLAHYGKIFTIERYNEKAFESKAADKKEFRVLEKSELLKSEGFDSEWLFGAAEFINSVEDKNHAHLFGFYVTSSARGTGLSSRLLLASERQLCLSYGIRSVDLSVSAENFRAVAFYKKNGYAACEIFKDFYGAGNHRLIMKKKF